MKETHKTIRFKLTERKDVDLTKKRKEEEPKEEEKKKRIENYCIHGWHISFPYFHDLHATPISNSYHRILEWFEFQNKKKKCGLKGFGRLQAVCSCKNSAPKINK